jgi:hypothetical protein
MIAEPPSGLRMAFDTPSATSLPSHYGQIERRRAAEARPSSAHQDNESLTLGRVVAALALVLATRRSAHSDDHGYWCSISRGV